jgi:hypothetical protein
MINDIISIRVMNNIFKECNKLSYGAMQLYQNILQHYFCDKEEVIGNLNDFEIKQVSIPNFTKHVNRFVELQNAKLISIDDEVILFHDVWTKHIHLFRMKTDFKLYFATDFKDEMYNSRLLDEAITMKYKLNSQDVHNLLQMFFAEQDGTKKQYPNESECRKHFMYWCKYNSDKTQKTSVKSKNKILGQNESKN